MTDKFSPDKDDRVTQIVVIEFIGKSAAFVHDYAQALEEISLKQRHGLLPDVDYMISVGQPDDMLSNPNLSDFMSSRQEGYLKKLFGDLRPLTGRYKAGLERNDALDPEVYARAETIMRIVFDEVDAHVRAKPKGTISPRRGSELIDAVKQVIEDLQGELNGV